MRSTATILKRELRSYFTTPVAYVFIVIFLLLTGIMTFYMGGFFEREQADLAPFFFFHPWLYLILVPAISMRLWAEEHKQRTVELLLTFPVRPFQAVLGKYIAALVLYALILACSLPIPVMLAVLGNPDPGLILSGYLGSFLFGEL